MNRLPENPSYDEIIQAIENSDPQYDWGKGEGGSKQVSFLKSNVNLRFEHEDEDIHKKDFKEPWANKHPDNHATSYWYELYYNSTLIKRFILVSVDGGRAILPPPRSRDDLSVSRLNFIIAKICGFPDTVDDYMERSGLSVEGTDKK